MDEHTLPAGEAERKPTAPSMGRVLWNAVLVRQTVCPCGFPMLNEDIEIGTHFLADAAKRTICNYRCGGCLEITPAVPCIGINSKRHPEEFRFLPLAMFDYQPVPPNASDRSHTDPPEVKQKP
jgi:hypothetical protein